MCLLLDLEFNHKFADNIGGSMSNTEYDELMLIERLKLTEIKINMLEIEISKVLPTLDEF